MADYQAILDAIDTAILAGVSQPSSLTVSGRTITYRSLKDLMDARTRISNLLQATTGTVAFQLHNVRHGDAK